MNESNHKLIPFPLVIHTMKRLILTFILLNSLSFILQAQTTPIQDFNQLRLKTNQRAMYVLGGWAATNITTGLILRSQATGTERYFHEMNVFWNLVNLGLADGPIISSFREQPLETDLWKTIKAQSQIEKILLFNAGLDLAYMASGAYLIERSKTNPANAGRAEQFNGYGQSLILQGGFLFVFDLTAFLIHQRNGNLRLRPLVGGQGVGMGFRF